MLSREEAVAAIREVADIWGSEALVDGIADSLRSVYLEDAAELRLVSDLLEEGVDKLACQHAHKLDTIVRECMPTDVWEFLDSLEEDICDVSDEQD